MKALSREKPRLDLFDQHLRRHVAGTAGVSCDGKPMLGLFVVADFHERVRRLAGERREPAALPDRLERLASGDALPRCRGVIAGVRLDRIGMHPGCRKPEPETELLQAAACVPARLSCRVEVPDHRFDGRSHRVDERCIPELVGVIGEPAQPFVGRHRPVHGSRRHPEQRVLLEVVVAGAAAVQVRPLECILPRLPSARVVLHMGEREPAQTETQLVLRRLELALRIGGELCERAHRGIFRLHQKDDERRRQASVQRGTTIVGSGTADREVIGLIPRLRELAALHQRLDQPPLLLDGACPGR